MTTANVVNERNEMTTPGDSRAITIKKLLNKAESRGVTDAERDAFNAKATELMLKWGIEEATLADADRAKIENIVQRVFQTDVPKSYSYEATCIGVEVAKAFNCRGILQHTSSGRVDLLVVGFESDVERVKEMFTSLALQATLALIVWYAKQDWRRYDNGRNIGTNKFNGKRTFLVGFADGVRAKFDAMKTQVIKESTPGTDLVLVNRVARVDDYIKNEMNVGRSKRRHYLTDARFDGATAGLRADVGGSKLGGNRSQIGG
jgi:hypothetical protein